VRTLKNINCLYKYTSVPPEKVTIAWFGLLNSTTPKLCIISRSSIRIRQLHYWWEGFLIEKAKLNSLIISYSNATKVMV